MSEWFNRDQIEAMEESERDALASRLHAVEQELQRVQALEAMSRERKEIAEAALTEALTKTAEFQSQTLRWAERAGEAEALHQRLLQTYGQHKAECGKNHAHVCTCGHHVDRHESMRNPLDYCGAGRCVCRKYTPNPDAEVCTCGFDAALTGTEEAKS